ncbi:MAG: serine hydrolase domain-containing protein [Bryobacteraceae bacterium]
MIKTLSVILAAVLCATAAPLPRSEPAGVGLSPERLQRVSALVKRYIDRGEIAGAVSLVARKGKVAHLEAQGVSDLATHAPMKTDAIFRLASMTKPITSLAAMMLLEEGRYLLDDPVSKFLPEYKDMEVALANSPNERFAGGYRTVPAASEITIRQLLTHTAGLPSGSAGPTMDAYAKLREFSKPDGTMARYSEELARLPLNFQPGAAWEYGPATNIVGRLVEAVSGIALDAFFRERIFQPLAMNDTYFYLPDAKLPRLATAYAKKDGKLEKLTAPGPAFRNGSYFAGAGGLAGSAEDYFRFCQMLLNNGQLDGVRLAGRKTIESMTTNHIDKIPLWLDTYRGYGFGLGFRVRMDTGQAATLGSVGEYGWGGAYGTYFFVDPKEELIGILMFQLIPYAHLNIRPEFQNAVNQAIVD